VAVLGKNIWGPGPSSFGRQQQLSEIAIEPIKNLGALYKIWGPPALAKTATGVTVAYFAVICICY